MGRSSSPLSLPDGLTDVRQQLLVDLFAENSTEHGSDLLGVVLSGSAGRGMGTERSDLDVYVVLASGAATARQTSRTPQIDEIPIGMDELETPPAFGTDGWWQRWSFAWTPVLFDRTGGRLIRALHRQATLTSDEQITILVDCDRLDGWLNFAYRALKNHRDGRDLEGRLDAAESLPWMLDTIFTLNGRVRPYNKYLSWELTHHPMDGWPAHRTLELIDSTLSGSPEALRSAFDRIESSCHDFDSRHGNSVLTDLIAGWGDELRLLRR